jgi:DNA-binding beta-propeller fold protein YncE
MLARKLVFFAVLFAAPAAADILDIFSSDKLTDGSRYAFVPSKTNNTVIAIDVQEHKVAATLELPRAVGSAIATNELSLLVVTHPDDQSASVINLYNREIIQEIDLGMRPDIVIANAYDRFVTFGSRDGSVSTWDLSNFEQVVRVDGLETALLMTFSFDGSHLFVVEPATKNIAIIDMAEREWTSNIPLGGDPQPDAAVSALSRSADGYTGFVSVTSENRLLVIDLASMTIKRSIPVGASPIRPFSTADNRYVLVPNNGDRTLTVFSPHTNSIVATIPTGIHAREVNTGWLDTVAFIMPAAGDEMAVVDLQDFSAAEPIPLPGRTDDGIVTSDSKTLVTAIVETGQVAFIDARARRLATLLDTDTTALEGMEIAVSNNVCH